MGLLKLTEIMPFGKHKGRVVGKWIIEDPDYACWLRDDAIKADPRNRVFNDDTHRLINDVMSRSVRLSRKFKQWPLKSDSVTDAAEYSFTELPKTNKSTEKAIKPKQELEVVGASYGDEWGGW